MTVARILRALRVGVLGIVVLAPLIAWLLTGPVGPYEGRPQTRYPAVSSVFSPDMAGRARFADAVMERSWIRRAALTARNTLDYYVFGGVEMESVVSGADGWLFYKPQFEAWDCDMAVSNRNGLEGLRFQAQLAAAGEVPLVFAIAPNKATIERARARGRAARYIGACYDETEGRLRELAASDETGLIVDHTAELRRIRTDGDQYYATDSHWNSRSAAAGFNQLMSQPPVALGVPQWDYETAPNQLSPGMGHGILQLNIQETDDRVVPEQVDWSLVDADAYPETVLVYHDSFYASLNRMIRARIRNVIDVNINQSGYRRNFDRLPEADAVVVERVERSLLQNFALPGRTAGSDEIYHWLLERNAETARDCAWQSGVDLASSGDASDSVEFRRMSRRDDDAFHPDEANPRVLVSIPADWAGAPVCVRIQVEAGNEEFAQLFVSGTMDPDVVYVGTRSVVWTLEPGRNELMVVLPGEVAGGTIRFHPALSRRDFAISEFSIAPRYVPDAGADAPAPAPEL